MVQWLCCVFSVAERHFCFFFSSSALQGKVLCLSRRRRTKHYQQVRLYAGQLQVGQTQVQLWQPGTGEAKIYDQYTDACVVELLLSLNVFCMICSTSNHLFFSLSVSGFNVSVRPGVKRRLGRYHVWRTGCCRSWPAGLIFKLFLHIYVHVRKQKHTRAVSCHLCVHTLKESFCALCCSQPQMNHNPWMLLYFHTGVLTLAWLDLF